MSQDRAAWLYALLSRLEEPLHQDMAAALRSLYRRCQVLRAAPEPSPPACLAGLNLCIAITGRHFGQGEEYVDTHNEAAPTTDTVVERQQDEDENEDDDEEDEEEEGLVKE